MQEDFSRELRFAYNHLYDWAVLRKSSLITLFDLQNDKDTSASLRNILRDAIQAIKPQGEKNQKIRSWRIYQLLYTRYIEQLSQSEAAHDLGLSLRHLRREETLALEPVGSFLWDRYRLEKKWQHSTQATENPELDPAIEITTPDRYSELEWLQQSIPFEAVKIQDLIHEILNLDDASIRKQMIQVEFNLSEKLPPVITKRTTIRQALLSIVNTIINIIPEGALEFSAEVRPSELSLIIEGFAVSDIDPPVFPDEEKTSVLYQLIDLSGGKLDIGSNSHTDAQITAIISLPVKDMVKVMVVDDNRDTLQFIARCLTGTRYLLIPVNQPDKAVETAVANQPQVIILDVMLPKIDGWELLGIFQNHPELSGIPIVIFSIVPQDQIAKDLGALAFLKKPVSRDGLLAFLDQSSNYFSTQ